MLVEGEEKPLYRCRVLYIGSAVPLEAAKGLEAVQQPLRERYPVKDEKNISGVDAVLSVMSSGIQLQYVGETSSLVWFPISSLTFCAAVRCIHLMNSAHQRVPRFVSLNSPAAGGIHDQKPAIFAAITRRTKGRKVLECHAFICSSPGDAISLVQSSKVADRAFRNGLNMSGIDTSFTPSRINSISSRQQSESELHLITDQKSIKSDVPPEFYDAPPAHGYFYGTGSTHVKKYTVERVNSQMIPNGVRTIDRTGFRRVTSPPLPHPHYMRGMAPSIKRQMSIPMSTLPPPRRFFSPPPQHVHNMGSRRDPYMYMQPRIPVHPQMAYPIAHHMSERTGDHSPSSGRSQESSGSNTTLQAETASPSISGKSSKDLVAKTAATNGHDAESSSGNSSRPATPPQDYDPLASAASQKSRQSRKDKHEKSKAPPMGAASPPPMLYPYNPYIYPAYYVPSHFATRPGSLPPPMEDPQQSSKSTKKKKEKKKKLKKKSKNSTVDDGSSDNVGYHSEVLTGSDVHLRSTIDRSRPFQNEKAFAQSIAEERKHGVYDQYHTPYRHYQDSAENGDLLY